MATKEVHFKGKAKWVHSGKPDKFGNYSMVLYPDEASLELFKKLKDDVPAILNRLKKDDDGYNFKLTCVPNKNINGKVIAFNVYVCKPDGTPLTESLVGNGSDVTVTCEHYTYRKGEGAALRLKVIRVDNLVPYTVQNSMTPEQQADVAGNLSQPQPVWG